MKDVRVDGVLSHTDISDKVLCVALSDRQRQNTPRTSVIKLQLALCASKQLQWMDMLR